MAVRSCPDWPELLDRAPDLHFKHYTADELQLPHDIVLALGDVRLASLEVCADTSRNDSTALASSWARSNKRRRPAYAEPAAYQFVSP